MRRFGCYITGLVIAGVLFGFGCDRWMPSELERPAPEGPPPPVNLAVQIGDRSLGLSWEMPSGAAASRFRIYRAESDSNDFDLIDSTSALSVTLADLSLGQSLRLRVTAISAAGIEGLPSDEITAVAGLYSLVLDNGEAYTRDRDVSVRFNVPTTPAYVELSEDPLFTGTLVETFAPVMSFEVSLGDGLKTIYARLTYADGSLSSGVLADSITLDTWALIESVSFAPWGVLFETGETIAFFVDAGGEQGGSATISLPGASVIDLDDEGVAPDALADDGIYSANFVVPVGLTVVNGIVTGNFRDAAGNSAPSAQAVQSITIQNLIAPEPVILAASLTDSVTAHLTWTRNDDDDFASYRIYRSPIPGFDVGAENLRIAIFNDRTVLSYDDYLADTGSYYYKVFVFDTQQLSAASNEVEVYR